LVKTHQPPKFRNFQLDLLAAQKGMASAVHAQYRPDASRAELYRTRYERYLALGGFAENFRVKE